MNQIDHKRRRLIRLITKYLSQSNIIIKPELTQHKQSLDEGSNLKPEHFSKLIPLLVLDMKMDPKEVSAYYQCLVGHNLTYSTTETQTLDEFFI